VQRLRKMPPNARDIGNSGTLGYLRLIMVFALYP
jgi:hypothetical protein